MPGGTNLLFEPVPMEFIRSYATQPQVIVKVNGLEALCVDLNCDYAYIDVTSEVTGQTLVGDQLTLTGTALPTSGDKITFGGVACAITS